MNSLLDSKKIMLVMILEQKVYEETLKMHILMWDSRMLILTHRKMLVEKVLSKHEQDKRNYNRRIMNVEDGTFPPFVYFVTGSEGTETSTFRCHLASKTALKKDERNEYVVNFIRCKLPFLILRSALTCVRGSRPYDKDSVMVDDFSLTCDSAGIQ